VVDTCCNNTILGTCTNGACGNLHNRADQSGLDIDISVSATNVDQPTLYNGQSNNQISKDNHGSSNEQISQDNHGSSNEQISQDHGATNPTKSEPTILNQLWTFLKEIWAAVFEKWVDEQRQVNLSEMRKQRNAQPLHTHESNSFTFLLTPIYFHFHFYFHYSRDNTHLIKKQTAVRQYVTLENFCALANSAFLNQSV
jgi:hypothetical protein